MSRGLHLCIKLPGVFGTCLKVGPRTESLVSSRLRGEVGLRCLKQNAVDLQLR